MLYKQGDDGTLIPVAGFKESYNFCGTHAAYDIAVAQGKIKEGMVIFFTDDTAEADTYSLEEVKTNKVWIDGKPIYRKVASATAISGETLVKFNQSFIGVSYVNVVMTMLKTPSGFWSDTRRYCTQQWLRAAGNYVFSLTTTSSEWIGGTVYVALEYTKTTD